MQHRGTKRPMMNAMKQTNPWSFRARTKPARGCCLVKDEGGDLVYKCPCPRALTIKPTQSGSAPQFRYGYSAYRGR